MTDPTERKLRPTDVRPGDLLATGAGTATVLRSELVEPQPRKGTRQKQRRPQWWITYIFTDPEGRPTKQSQKYSPARMTEECVRLVRSVDDTT